MRMCIFQFPIDLQIRHKWLEKCYPKDKFIKAYVVGYIRFTSAWQHLLIT